MEKSLLVIDDEASHRLMVRAITQDAGWHVEEAPSGEDGIEAFKANPGISVALVDMKMPGIDGHETLRRLHAIKPTLPVILLTAYGTVGSAVEAMKHGAFDYLTKPADNDELLLTLTRAWEYSKLQNENSRLRAEVSSNEVLQAIVGVSPAIHKIHELIRQAGPSEATVLITGESGTGKERIAEALHAASSRSANALVKVNCAALPAQLLESELFGYEKGAFTGAVKDKPGRFQLASGGTLFLDEVGEIPLDLQAKLLRAIQERVIEPLGSVRSLPVDVRILAATNKNLYQAVKDGEFREDLFFRLNVLEIVSPPLREHLEDLPVLISHLLQKLSDKNKKNVRSISPQFLEYLSHYSWPGNVRELENVLERALILSRSDTLEPESLPHHITLGLNQEKQETDTVQSQLPLAMGSILARPPLSEASENSSSPPELPEIPLGSVEQGSQAHLLEQAEKKALIKALALHKGHRQDTAEALGISRRTLQYKLKKYGLNQR